MRTLADAVNPYSWIMTARNLAFDAGVLKSRRFGIPTICIGNISVGGTGKTPHTEYIIGLLKEEFGIAVLSRGYGRRSKGYIKADETSTMQQIGDEPLQIKEKFKEIDVAVCEDRVKGIEHLTADNKRLQVILLDDAFQHRYVSAGLNILLIDSNHPIWNDNVMPFGRLRERVSGIERADIVIMTKCKGVTDEQKEEWSRYIKERKEIPVFFSTVSYGKPYPLFDDASKGITTVSGHRVLLVTGIAKPQPLKAELEERGAEVELMQYDDHHSFTTAEFEDIARHFAHNGCTVIVTTEKDATRIRHRQDLPQTIRENIYALPIEVKFLDNDAEKFNENIYNYVTENSRNS